MILIIDNYDSFVYNLGRYIGLLGHSRIVKRNDELTLKEIETLAPTHIVLSPGPCTPNEAGICLDIVKRFGASVPILGVCLGHQVIGQAYGAEIVRAKNPMHGKSSQIIHQKNAIFKSLPNPLSIGRYHSLIVSPDNFPSDLEIIAKTDQNEIMALKHKIHPVYGVQFHPESVLTDHGEELLENFLQTSESCLQS